MQTAGHVVGALQHREMRWNINAYHGCVTTPSRMSEGHHITREAANEGLTTLRRKMIMRTIVSTLLALSLLAAAAAPASAAKDWTAEDFWKQQQTTLP
jgi:hypothetical protein